MRENNTLYYLVGDHLGSTSVVANASGGFASELRYTAWGETRYSSGTMPTDFRFTGQRQTQGAGLEWLYYYNARWYDPTVGRFLQADTIVPEPGKGQAYNRYTYVTNNPIRYVDPTGHAQEDDEFHSSNLPIPRWNPHYEHYLSEQSRAQQAYLHLLEDPLYFAGLYVDPVSWNQSSEVRLLELFAEYSELRSSAASLLLSQFSYEDALILKTQAEQAGIELAQQKVSSHLGGGVIADIITLAGVVFVGYSAEYPMDWSDNHTVNEGIIVKTEGEARAMAQQYLGQNLVEVAQGKWRSEDGRWQYRAKTNDVAQNHIHLERVDPNTGYISRNIHIYWDPTKSR